MISLKGCVLVTHQINTKDGGFTITVDFPESNADELAELIKSHRHAFDMYLDFGPDHDSPEVRKEIEAYEEIESAVEDEDLTE